MVAMHGSALGTFDIECNYLIYSSLMWHYPAIEPGRTYSDIST
jgi:hypothetical protein